MSKQILVVTLLLAGSLTSRAFAQGGTTGAISGLVTDSQGAVIPGATVQATNESTGVVTKTTTNDSGVYTFPYLPFGPYHVGFNAKGMKENIIQGIRVDEGNISRVDSVLQVGAANEVVNVTAAAPLIEQESVTYNAEIEKNLLDDLPSEFSGGTRDASAILAILPGVETPGATNNQSYGTQFGVNVGGGRQFTTEFQMDGMSLSYQPIYASVPLDERPDYDTVSETKVQEGVPSAEFGRTSGGVVEFLTRSGTDQYHGDAGMYLHNTIFDAHPYYTDTVPVDQQWNLELSGGGPVWIPKVIDGRKKKLFFFGNLSEFRERGFNYPSVATIPTEQELTAGNFSDQPATIYDPTTGLPFPNNTVPPARWDSIGKQLAALYPQPTSSGLSSNFSGSSPSNFDETDYFVRLDYAFKENNRLTAWHRYRYEDNIASPTGNNFGPAFGGSHGYTLVTNEMISDDWTISPHVVNHVAIENLGFSDKGINEPNNPAVWFPVPGSYGPGFPGFCFETNGYEGIGYSLTNCSVDLGTTGIQDWTRDAQDTVFWNKGHHNIKFGFRYMWSQWANYTIDQLNGFYGFSSAETAQIVDGTPVAGTGNSFASLLLGLTDYATASDPVNPDLHNNYYGAYAQDDWRVNKNLSVSYGMRWDVQAGVYDTRNRLAEMNPNTSNPEAGGFPGAYVFASQQGVRYFYPVYFGAFSPRLGFAYSVRPDLVVRGGVGVLLAPPYQDAGTQMIDSTGYSTGRNLSSPGSGVPALVLDQGWTNLPLPPNTDPGQNNGATANTAAPNIDHWPATNIWQLDIEKSIFRDYVFDVGYIGESSHHIANPYDPYNQVKPGYLALGPLLADSITDPAVVAAGYAPPYPGFTGTLAQALKPFPQYQSVNDVGNEIFGSNYNALMIKAQKRTSYGLTYLVSYTISKTLSNAPLNAFGYLNAGGPQNAYDLRAEKYLAPWDIPQNLTISYTYALPVGPGRTFLNHGPLSMILGGWATSGILQYTSGVPIGIVAPLQTLTSVLGSGRLNAEYLGGPIKEPHRKIVIAGNAGGSPGTITLNSSAFGQPAPFTFGNSYILPSTRQVGFNSEDISFFKRETFHDRYILELRFEMFDAFNRTSPSNLDEGLTDASFGQYLGSAAGPRTCQLGGKITF